MRHLCVLCVLCLVWSHLSVGATELLPFSLASARWRAFRNAGKVSGWSNLTRLPDKLGQVTPEPLDVRDGIIALHATDRDQTDQPAYLLVEFESDRHGMMVMGCDAMAAFSLIVNQTPATRRRLRPKLDPAAPDALRHPDGTPLSPLANQALIHVRKGRNLIAIQLNGHRSGAGWFFVFAPAPDGTLWLPILPTAEHLDDLRANAYPFPGTPGRTLAEQRIQEGVNGLYSDIFRNYDSKPDLAGDALRAYHREWPILALYDQALDRLLAEIPTVTPPHQGAVVWLLYNMGYVIKTPSITIGIDIHHRRAKLLEPLLDALLITHNHGDHLSRPLIDAMLAKGKRVFSSFIDSSDKSSEPRDITLGDLTIQTDITDHNAKLLRFMTTYRIICGDESRGAPVLFHTGDSCNHRQLRPRGRVDVHMVHPRVGLSVPEAAAQFHPRAIFFSHLLEMGHCKPGPYRPIAFADAYQDIRAMARRQLAVRSFLPLWGEHFVLPPHPFD